MIKKQLTQNAIQNDEPVAGPSWKQDVPTRMITRSKAQPRKPILDDSEKVSGQDNNWDFSPMQDNDGASQSDDLSDEDREEKRPVKKRKKNLPIVESDTEDSELESVNEMDSKEQNSDTKNKKRPVIVNDKSLSGNIIQSRDIFFTRKDALSYFVTIDGLSTRGLDNLSTEESCRIFTTSRWV